MTLITRQYGATPKGSKLSIEEMDNNLLYLENIALTSSGPQGPQGSQGPVGSQGSVGAQGATGTQGSQGSAGSQGSQGPQGPQGSQGAVGSQGSAGASVTILGSYADYAAFLAGAGGSPGTNVGDSWILLSDGSLYIWNGSSWFDSGDIKGPQGSQGVVGAQGAQGAVGSQGVQGAQGSVGAQGTQGPQGSQGNTGAQGAQGAVGPQGSQGAAGSQGPQGIQGIQGIPGSSTILYSGTFFDNTTQNNGGATTANLVAINSTQTANGITLANNTITIDNAGVYFLSASLQLTFTGGASNYNVTIWYTVDNVIVPNSAFTFTTTGAQNDQTLATITDTIALTAGQSLKFYWWSQATGMKLLSTAAGSNPSRPLSPSVNITMFNVA